jgi:hypothetical protein
LIIASIPVKSESWDFCVWLKGCIDMVKEQSYNQLSQNQIKIIRDKLSSVFVHEIDPSFGAAKEKLDKIHNPPPYTPIVPFINPNDVLWATNPPSVTTGYAPSSPWLSTGVVYTNPGQIHIPQKVEHQGQSITMSYSTNYNLPQPSPYHNDQRLYSC